MTVVRVGKPSPPEWTTGRRWAATYVVVVVLVALGSMATYIGYDEASRGPNIAGEFTAIVTAPWSMLLPDVYARERTVLAETLLLAGAGLPNVGLLLLAGWWSDRSAARRRRRRRRR